MGFSGVANVDFADQQKGGSFVYHHASDGGANRFWRNVITAEDWRFIDATTAAGFDVGGRAHSLAASWEDIDQDGDQDLYVANDYGPNALYQNNNGSFTEIAASLGIRDQASGMSVSWGNANRDRRSDLYVGNMFSSAGSRLTKQPGFLQSTSDEVRKLYPRFSRGNSLFLSGSDASYQDVSASMRVTMGRWAWSSLFVDLDNDGWDDLAVANGYITAGDDTGDL